MPGRTILAAAVVAVLVALCGEAGAAAQTTLTDNRYDFGSVKQGTHISHEFTVRNTGDGPLRFTGAELTMPGMQARFGQAELPPGAEGKVTIDWATDHVGGAVEGSVRIRSNDPRHPALSLSLVGTVVPPISIEPMPAVFLSSFANEPAERVLTVRNNTDRPLELSVIESGPHTSAAVAPIDPGKAYKVSVSAKPPVAPGRYEESLTLQTGSGPVTLPVHVWIKPDLYANPDAVDLGAVRADAGPDAVGQSVVLKRREGEFAIESVTSDVPALSVTRSPASGRSAAFKLDVRVRAQALAAAQSLAGTIRVRTSDPRFPEIDIPVSGAVVAGNGTARN